MKPRNPSASSLDRAMACPASEALPRVSVDIPAGREGTWKHRVWQHLSKGIEAALVEAGVTPEQRDEALALEGTWVAPSGADHEIALAFDANTGKGRRLQQKHHRDYSDAKPDEWVATVDACYSDGFTACVVDFKSGHAWVAPPADNWQLKLGALAAAASADCSAARVGIVKPGWREPQWADFDAIDLSNFRDELQALGRRLWGARKAVEEGAVPKLSIGEWCRFCPARLHCPAQVATVKRLGGEPDEWAADMKRQLTPETAGLAWARLEMAKKALGEVEGALRMYAKDAPLLLPDGRRLRLQTVTRDELDGAVVFEALSEHWGHDVARAAVELEATKKGLERAARRVYEAEKQAGRGATIKGTLAAALELVRARGGIVQKETQRMVDEREALPEGEAA